MSLFARLFGNRRHTVALEEGVNERLAAGDLVAARALAEEALTRSPGSPAVHHLSGVIALREGRADAAVAHLRTAAAADPRSTRIRQDLEKALHLAQAAKPGSAGAGGAEPAPPLI